MQLRLITALLLASVTAAQAQHLSQHQAQPQNSATTPASQMAARASANASQGLDAASGGMAGLYASPDDTSSDQPSDAQRIIRGSVNGKPGDPVLHYPYGRYQPTLGNVDPNSLGNTLANPLARGAPGTVSPPLQTNVPAFSPGFSRPFGTGAGPAFSHGR